MDTFSGKVLAEAKIDENGLLIQPLEDSNHQRQLQCLILEMNTSYLWYSLNLSPDVTPELQLKEHITKMVTIQHPVKEGCRNSS